MTEMDSLQKQVPLNSLKLNVIFSIFSFNFYKTTKKKYQGNFVLLNSQRNSVFIQDFSWTSAEGNNKEQETERKRTK